MALFPLHFLAVVSVTSLTCSEQEKMQQHCVPAAAVFKLRTDKSKNPFETLPSLTFSLDS